MLQLHYPRKDKESSDFLMFSGNTKQKTGLQGVRPK